MKPSTLQILNSVLASDETITEQQRDKVIDILMDRVQQVSLTGPLLLRSGEAAKLLGISRCTLWRMTKESLLHPVKFRGISRYRVSELFEIAQEKKA